MVMNDLSEETLIQLSRAQREAAVFRTAQEQEQYSVIKQIIKETEHENSSYSLQRQ